MTGAFTLVQLRYFCAVARVGSMTAAAKELSTSQSTLSDSIAHLEQAMKVRLFERTPRRTLELTLAGRRLLSDALTLLEDVDRLALTARGDTDTLAGELVVGVFTPLSSFRASVILSAFQNAHPAVKLSLLEGDQESIRQALVRRRCDVALMYDIGLDPGFTTSTVERLPPHIVVHTQHQFAKRLDGVHLRDIAGEPLILLDLPHTRDYYLSLFQQLNLHPSIRFQISSYETVRSFVSSGHGYSVLNQVLPHSVTNTGMDIVRIPLCDDLPEISVVVVHVRGMRPSRKAVAFEEICRRVYADGRLGQPQSR